MTLRAKSESQQHQRINRISKINRINRITKITNKKSESQKVSGATYISDDIISPAMWESPWIVELSRNSWKGEEAICISQLYQRHNEHEFTLAVVGAMGWVPN